MHCDHCNNSVDISTKDTVNSLTPEKSDGSRDPLSFCGMACYDKYFDNNYVKIPYSRFTDDDSHSWYWDFKENHLSVNIGNFE